MSLGGSESPLAIALLELGSNEESDCFDEKADEIQVGAFEGGLELQQGARDIEMGVCDEAAKLANRLVDDGRGGRVEALRDGVSSGFGFGV